MQLSDIWTSNQLFEFWEGKVRGNEHLMLERALNWRDTTERWLCSSNFFLLKDGDVNLLVYITGTGFSGDSQALEIAVNKTSCKVIFSNQTKVVCQTDPLPVGVHQISMLVRPSGRAIDAGGQGLFLDVEPRLDAVEPSRAAEIGNWGSPPHCIWPSEASMLVNMQEFSPAVQ